MKRTALFLSPHLDDVVFSCGGLAAVLHDRGWHTILATAFTATVLPTTGFALACQLDKGLSPDVDYMALRRAEDMEAARILGFDEVLHLNFAEAPHRGYESAQALFGDIHDNDAILPALSASLAQLQHDHSPELVVAPQGLGNHVDHIQMVRAVDQAIMAALVRYRDTPYAIRHSIGERDPVAVAVDITKVLHRKLQASCAYATQIGYQFGGAEQTATALRNFASSEAGDGTYAERLALSDDSRTKVFASIN